MASMLHSGRSEDNAPRKISPVVGIGYIQKDESDLESFQQSSPQNVGFFTMLKTTGFIPYNVVPTHSAEIPDGVSMEDVKTDKYWTRWYTLLLSSLLFFNLVLVWGSLTPVSETVLYAYPTWTDQVLASFTLYVSITIFFCGLPMNWVVQETGLRPGIIMVGVITSASATLRCLSNDEYIFKVMCIICSWTVGLSMSLTLALPAPLAAAWFPLNERTFATAVAGLATQLGYAGIYMAGLLVKIPEDIEDPGDIWKARSEIHLLINIYAISNWVLTIIAILYFPSRPPLPPTLTASEKHLSFYDGFKSIMRNKNARLAVLAYILSYGIIAEWLGVMSFTLTDMGFNQDQIMSTGIISIVISALSSALSGAIADNFLTHKRIPIIILLALSALSFLALLLMHMKIIQDSVIGVSVAIAAGLAFQYSAMPLLVDMTVELAYPCSGNVVGSLEAAGYNGMSILFLSGYQFSTSNYTWVSMCLVASQTLPIIPLLFLKEEQIKKEKDTLHMSLMYQSQNKVINSTSMHHIIESQKKIIDGNGE